MSLLPTDVYYGPGLPIWLKNPISSITVSSATIQNLVGISSAFQSISTNYVIAQESFVKDKLTFPNQVLSSAGTALLLNGVAIATVNNLSSISTWSYDPAISTVQINNNNMTGISTFFAQTGFTSSLTTSNLTAVNIITSNLAAYNIINFYSTSIETFTSTLISEIDLARISSMYVGVGAVSSLNVSSLNFVSSIGNSLTVSNSAFITGFTATDTATFSNGANFYGSRPNFTTGINTSGANNFNNTNIDNAQNILGNTLFLGSPNYINLQTSSYTAILNDRGADVGGFSQINLTSKFGQGTRVNITADAASYFTPAAATQAVNITANASVNYNGVAGGGAVNIVANGAVGETTSVLGNGVIRLTAFSALSSPPVPGLILQSAGSISAYSGLASPATGVYGCSFYSALVTLSLTCGATPVTTSFPGVVYLRGDNGTKVVNGLYVDSLNNNAGFDLNIASKTADISNRNINIDSALDLKLNSSNGGQIYLNGAVYPPASGAGVWASTATTDLNMAGYNIRNAGTISSLNVYAGAAAIGTPSFGSAFAYFGHNALASGDYALIQSDGGETLLNCKLYSIIRFRNGNYDIMVLTSDTLDMSNHNISNVSNLVMASGAIINASGGSISNLGNIYGSNLTITTGGNLQLKSSTGGNVIIQTTTAGNVSVNGVVFTTNATSWTTGTVHTLFGDLNSGGKYIKWSYDNNPGTQIADNNSIELISPLIQLNGPLNMLGLLNMYNHNISNIASLYFQNSAYIDGAYSNQFNFHASNSYYFGNLRLYGSSLTLDIASNTITNVQQITFLGGNITTGSNYLDIRGLGAGNYTSLINGGSYYTIDTAGNCVMYSSNVAGVRASNNVYIQSDTSFVELLANSGAGTVYLTAGFTEFRGNAGFTPSNSYIGGLAHIYGNTAAPGGGLAIDYMYGMFFNSAGNNANLYASGGNLNMNNYAGGTYIGLYSPAGAGAMSLYSASNDMYIETGTGTGKDININSGRYISMNSAQPGGAIGLYTSTINSTTLLDTNFTANRAVRIAAGTGGGSLVLDTNIDLNCATGRFLTIGNFGGSYFQIQSGGAQVLTTPTGQDITLTAGGNLVLATANQTYFNNGGFVQFNVDHIYMYRGYLDMNNHPIYMGNATIYNAGELYNNNTDLRLTGIGRNIILQTFSGGLISLSGTVNTSNNVFMNGGYLQMNCNAIRICSDQYHALVFGNSGTYNVGVNGPYLVGYANGALGTSGTSFNNKSLEWSYTDVYVYKRLDLCNNNISNVSRIDGVGSPFILNTSGDMNQLCGGNLYLHTNAGQYIGLYQGSSYIQIDSSNNINLNASTINVNGKLDMHTNDISNLSYVSGSNIVIQDLGGNLDLLSYRVALPSGFLDLSSTDSKIDFNGYCYISRDYGTSNFNIKASKNLSILTSSVTRNLGATEVVQPVIAYGTATGSGASGSVTVALPAPFTSATSYIATASMMDTTAAKMSVNRDNRSTITIYWSQAGSGSQSIGWTCLGN